VEPSDSIQSRETQIQETEAAENLESGDVNGNHREYPVEETESDGYEAQG